MRSSGGPSATGTIVIGLGSPLMADDGVGIRALELLRAGWSFEPHVELVDGGTWGMQLLPLIEDADRILFLDAIDWKETAGNVVRLERNELPKFMSQKLSPHQIDLKEVLAVAELRGTLSEETVALGIQPAEVRLSNSLSPEAERGLDRLLEEAVRQLQVWGHSARRRAHADA